MRFDGFSVLHGAARSCGAARRGGAPGSAAPARPLPPPPDVAAPPKDATTLPSGLAFKVLQPGTGTAKPAATDMVTVHYTGWTTDGKMFDSSRHPERPEHVPARPRHQGLGRRRAADDRRREAPPLDPRDAGLQGPGRPAGRHAGVRHRAASRWCASPTVPPPDVAAAPADAKRTASGLAYKVLKAGTGTAHPRRESRVTVHYTGLADHRQDVRQLGDARDRRPPSGWAT